MPKHKKCAGCGDEYEPKRKDQNFCRRGCSNIRRTPRPPCRKCASPAIVKGFCRAHYSSGRK